MKRRLAALCLALTLCAGCATSGAQINRHNAAVYVLGVLDETYSGNPSEVYQKLTGRTQADAEKAFRKNLEAEYAQRLCLRFDLEEKYISRGLKQDFLALLDTVYQRARYTVKTATPLEDGRYCVEVSVTPVTFFAAAYQDGYKALRQDFDKAHPQEEPSQEDEALTDAQRRKAEEAREQAWAQAVYDYLYTRLDAITTGAAVTKLVLVLPDSQGLYALSETDLQDVDDLILQY